MINSKILFIALVISSFFITICEANNSYIDKQKLVSISLGLDSYAEIQTFNNGDLSNIDTIVERKITLLIKKQKSNSAGDITIEDIVVTPFSIKYIVIVKSILSNKIISKYSTDVVGVEDIVITPFAAND